MIKMVMMLKVVLQSVDDRPFLPYSANGQTRRA